MPTRTFRRLEDVDRRRMELLDALAHVDPDLLTRRPAPDRWSIGEVVEHMVLAERDVLRGLPHASELRHRRRRIVHRLAYPAVIFVLRFGIPVRVPAEAMLPAGRIRLPELRALWDENHRWLRAYVGGLDRRGLRRAVFRHPVAGPLTVRQAVAMLDIHFRRHVGQIRDLQASLARAAGPL